MKTGDTLKKGLGGSRKQRGAERVRIWIVAALLLFFGVPAAYADMVYYKSGETLKGLVIEEHHDRIVVSTEAGEWTVLRRDLQEVFYDDPERNYLYMGNQALSEENFSLAQMFYRRALQIKPGFVEAEDAMNRLADLKKKFESGESYPDSVAALKSRWGITVQEKQNLLEVATVSDGSVARKAGITQGDKFLAAWGNSLAFMSPEDLAKAFLGPAGSSIRVTIQRKITAPTREKGLKWPGVTLDMQPLGLTVTGVEATGVLAKAGVLPSDRILEINGLPMRYTPLNDARKLLRDAKGNASILICRDILIKRE